MKKVREKRIESLEKQVELHKEKIENEEGSKDTTKDYWKKEIDRSFLKKIKEDKEYLEDENGSTDKKNN